MKRKVLLGRLKTRFKTKLNINLGSLPTLLRNEWRRWPLQVFIAKERDLNLNFLDSAIFKNKVKALFPQCLEHRQILGQCWLKEWIKKWGLHPLSFHTFNGIPFPCRRLSCVELWAGAIVKNAVLNSTFHTVLLTN